MTEKKLTRLEEELLTDLYLVEEQFRKGHLETGTIRSKVMYKMASRRGKTRPAPVHGLVQAERVFKGTFTRTVNRLISQKLIRKRSVQTPSDFHGRSYQFGFAQHARRERDLFLTDKGREVALGLVRQQELPGEDEVADAGAGQPEQEKPVRSPESPPVRGRGRSFSPMAGIEYVYTSAARKAGKVVHRHTVRMGPGKVTYIYTRAKPEASS